MPTPVLIPALVQLRDEINRIAPGRDRTSDGTLGDRAHQGRASDHNDDEVGRVPIRDADTKHEIHALDIDADLRTPGLSVTAIVLHIVRRCAAGLENRLRYIIWNRTIWEASDGWAPRPYLGDNPHTGHVHFSGSYNTKLEADTRSWRLEDIPVALTDADKKWLSTEVAKIVDARVDQLSKQVSLGDGTHSTTIGHVAWQQGIPNPYAGKRTYAWQLLEDIAEKVAALTPPPPAD